MISFITPTALPIEAATTMGVSVKEGDNAIGKFGTGLKYAIAGILRLGGSVTIWIRGERHEFTAHASNIRGRDFQIVHCNGAACGFTTELGKHWQPWQLFRELASNALDEGGRWTNASTDASAGVTVIRVACRELEDAERTEQVFLQRRNPLVESSAGATIHEGPSRHYYYRGIRAGSFDSVAPVTVDINNGTLSEDRLLDLATVHTELAWAFRSATKWDPTLLLQVLPAKEPGSFWVRHMSEYALSVADLPKDMMEFIAERPKFVAHPGFAAALKAYQRKTGVSRWTEEPMTSRHESMLAAGERMCLAVGVDPIPREKVHFTRDLDDRTLAVTCMDTRHVWFSTQLALRGRDEFLSGYLEEALHAMTGLRDCTREFQNAMLAMIVSMATRGPAIEVAA